MISEKASKLDLIERWASLTMTDILHHKYPSIGSLECINGKEAVVKVMAVIVADLSTSFGGDLKIEEIQEVVTEIRSGLSRNVTLEGLYMTCTKIKRTSTFKLKVPTILKAIDEHLEEQTQAVIKANFNHHLKFKFNEPRLSESSSTDEKFLQFRDEYVKRNLQK